MSMTYNEKLKDPRWQKKRLRIFERDGFKCKKCSDELNTLHVHHIRYLPGLEPWEYEDSDLDALCFHCHYVIESIKDQEVPYESISLLKIKVPHESDATCLIAKSNEYSLASFHYYINGSWANGLIFRKNFKPMLDFLNAE